MRRLLLSMVLVISCMLVFAAPSFAHKMAPPAVEACANAVEKQFSVGVEAGGGPKTGIGEVPLNCDHFWFRIGAIGHDHSGGP